jgi:cob(I)alamin adenosyltransferase
MGRGRSVVRLLFRGAISALLIALVIRLLDEMVGQHRRDGRFTSKDLERAEEVADAYEAELIELERTVLPGISIRS